MAGDKERDALAAATLVDRAKRGDRRAFGELVRRYRPRILALTLHLTGSESDAEDVTQEVFIKAYRALDSFEGRSQFFTWVYRMAVNRSLNARRDKKRRREELVDDPRVARAVQVDARGNPGRAAELRQTYAALLHALDALPAEMCTSVVLVALQGLNHGEAAVVQNCSPGTVAWRIHEARKRLRKALAKDAPHRAADRSLSAEMTQLLHQWCLPVVRAH
ncbi:MAG TPA: sigma-70 family RNA polymerase sigma factor [Kofleriaceae bacterium]|nr:sigma-70 family RNA polymerase sigma factor [Kofleriaceae bacterium]